MKVDAALRVHVLTGAASRGMAVNASDRFNVGSGWPAGHAALGLAGAPLELCRANGMTMPGT